MVEPQLFHKCGGTTIIQNILGCKNTIININEKLFYNNGNIWKNKNKKRQILEIWNFNQSQLDKLKVPFFSLEWNYFTKYNQLDLNQYKQIVCFRKPYSRYISEINFNDPSRPPNLLTYDLFKKYPLQWKRKESPNQRFNINFNQDNYYTKMLNGLGQYHNINVDDSHLSNAKERLNKFSIILILEQKETFKLLEKIGVEFSDKVKKKPIDKNILVDKKAFEKNNKYDILLYQYAVQLSNQQLKLFYDKK